MTIEEFRKYGHQTVDWMADYYEKIEEFKSDDLETQILEFEAIS